MFENTGGFSTQTASLGFGNSSMNTFGQPNQLYGSTPGNINSSAPVFGSSTQPMLGNTPSSGTALFGTTSTPTFGKSNQSGFGTPFFGNSGQPSSSGTFGSSSATSFGQQDKSTGFGFSSNSGGDLFSRTSQQNQQNAPSVFQSSSATNLFGNTGTFGNTGQMGTVVKFVPVMGTGSVQKSGRVRSINTKHHCIIGMKEYEGKSLEELRFEDYQSNRKGPHQQQPFGQPQPFGIVSTSSSMFGQSDKSMFGAPNTDFGGPHFGMSTQTTTPNIFGKPSTGFGISTSFSGSTSATNTSSTGLFGSTNTNRPFAAPTNQIFGSTQPQQSTFGNVFGQINTQNTGIFGKPGPTAFNTSEPGFTFGASQNHSNLFQSSKPITGFGTFGQSYQTAVLGQSQQNTFGLNTTTGMFGKPGTTGFNTSQSGFTFGVPQNQSTCSNVFQSSKPSTGFESVGQSSQASALGQSQQNTFGLNNTGLFGKPGTTGFNTSQSGFTFGVPQNQSTCSNVFQSSKPSTGFESVGQSSQASVLGQSQQNTFGLNNTGLFGKPGTTGFNTSQPSFTFGIPQNQSNLSQNSKPTTGFESFGQSSQAPALGQSQPNTFGLNTTFGKPVSTFGQPIQPTFGTQSTFGNTQSLPLSGNTTGSFLGNTFQQNTPLHFNTQQQQQSPFMSPFDSQTQELRVLLQWTDSYGYNKHLEGLSPLKPTTPAYVANPKDLQKLLESPSLIAVVSPMNKRLPVLPITAKKINLFDEMLEEMHDANPSLGTSAKRLLINKERRKRAESARESPPIIPLDVKETVDSRLVHNTMPQITTKLDITPADKYKEKQQEQPQDSISSLMSMNRNLMKVATPSDPLPITLSPSVEDENVGTSTKENQENIVVSEKPVDTCGVKLTHSEYYTLPPLDKLIEHKQSDGQCLVKGFTIGRVAYGNVCFPDLMDISNLNLDELVHIQYREVTIYPDDTKKPPVGQGLNRRAQVTLDRVFPKSKMDRKLITDPETLTSINFADTLKDLCEKQGTTFLDYRPETGSWVFMVDHFSKYGFSDSDEEEFCAKAADRQHLTKQLEEKKKNGQHKLKEEFARNEERRLLKSKL